MKARGEKLEKVGKWPEAAEELRCHRKPDPVGVNLCSKPAVA